MTDKILSRQFHGAEGAKAWRVLPDGAYAFFRSDSFIGFARFIDAISGLVHEGNEPDIDIRGDRRQVRARVAEGEERSELWEKMNAQYEGFEDYDRRTSRDIAVFVLEPR